MHFLCLSCRRQVALPGVLVILYPICVAAGKYPPRSFCSRYSTSPDSSALRSGTPLLTTSAEPDFAAHPNRSNNDQPPPPPYSNSPILQFLKQLIKPVPPKPGDCCGQGCAHCVWDLYRQDLAAYQTARSATLREQSDGTADEPLDNEVIETTEVDEAETLDPGIKAFLELERKLSKG